MMHIAANIHGMLFHLVRLKTNCQPSASWNFISYECHSSDDRLRNSEFAERNNKSNTIYNSTPPVTILQNLCMIIS